MTVMLGLRLDTKVMGKLTVNQLSLVKMISSIFYQVSFCLVRLPSLIEIINISVCSFNVKCAILRMLIFLDTTA